jgi:hypothetical protein
MSNANSITGVTTQGSARNQWPTQAIAATTETIFTVGTDAGTTQFFLTPPSPTGIYGTQKFIDEASNAAITGRSGVLGGLANGESSQGYTTDALAAGRLFKVRLVGTGNAGANAAQSVIVKLYQGTSTTVASNHALATTGAALATVAGGAFNFSIEATLLWDSTSQILSGYYLSNIAFATTSQFTTSTVVTTVNGSITAALLSFNGTITMGNAAASTVKLSEFVIDRV